MKEFRYLMHKVIQRIAPVGKKRKKELINRWFRRNGVSIGEDCAIFSNILSSEPYLIEIGHNVTISNDVQLITHDNGIIKPSKGKYTDVFGKITIGNNCFIGAHTIILPGVCICDNVIIAAGSVVSKTIKEKDSIWGGNPAHILGKWDTYMKNNENYALNTKGKNYQDKKNYLLDNPNKMRIR